MLKVNGHRTATIADLEHAEAVMGAGAMGPEPTAAPAAAEMAPGDGLEQQERQFAHFQSDAPRLRQLRRAHGPMWHLLPLLQLRQ